MADAVMVGSTAAARDKTVVTPVEQIYPKEWRAIRDRRTRYSVAEDAARCGLALSGGGIRSATFSLGVLRALSEAELLQRLDYLSTVSGGGYAGSFFCGLFAKRGKDDGPQEPPIIDPDGEKDLLGQEDAQRSIRYLRQSGRYLTPAGGSDYVYAAALLVRNWLALTLVFGMLIFASELLLDLGRFGLARHFSFFAENPWVSPVLVLLIPNLALIFGAGWAYWLTMSDVSHPFVRPPLWGTILIIAAAGLALFGLPLWGEPLSPEVKLGTGLVGLEAVIGLVFWIAGVIAIHFKRTTAGIPVLTQDHELAMAQNGIRLALSKWQSTLAVIALILFAAFVADCASFIVTAQISHLFTMLSPLVAILVPVARWFLRAFAALKEKEKGKDDEKQPILSKLAPLVIWLVAAILVLAALAFWGGLAHWIAVSVPLSGPSLWYVETVGFWIAVAGAGLFILAARSTHGFANLSSLATFYAARLRRAYLGAGNRARIGTDGHDMRSVREGHPGDDLGLYEYFQRTHDSAPVHLINVTINETKGKGPQTVQRDRQGLNMVISPDGMSYSEVPHDGVTVRPLGDQDKKQMYGKRPGVNCIIEKPGQSLPLSSWVGISGAAFTTGLGSQTSLAKSVIAFLVNVRLGYWWNCNRDALDATSTYQSLLREMRADFPGTDGSQWYLSDGGHFENTAVYELVRRKVPLVVVCDNGCDPDYGFVDLANLVRKCRIDFDTDITFLDENELSDVLGTGELRRLFESLDNFSSGKASPDAVALLGKMTFPGGSKGTLLVIKPRIIPCLPADITRYHADHPEFPQQTTFDQFFDESQWESYFSLGRIIGTQIFAEHDRADWQPSMMTPVPW